MTVETSQTPSAAIDSDRWPAVAKVPRGPLAAASAAIANRLLRRTATHLPLRLVYSDGTATGAADPRAPSLFIHRPDALARRIGRHGLIGFGESYMAGEWSSKELTRVLTVLAGSVDELVPRSLHWLRPITPTFRPSWPDHSRDQARRNIAVHYDLSNDLFAAFLDETMTYSCAMFTDLLAQPTPAWTELAAAQRRKIDRLLDVAGVQQGSHVLEIGTGWGELCIRAAARGAHIRSVTLSVEQQRLARQRVAAAGFGHRVEIDLCDYRDVDGQYDSVVSVEMIEAVGYRSWPRYFAALEQLVRPGGPVAIQAITMPHHRMLATRHTQTWIQKYIFPGGLLPSHAGHHRHHRATHRAAHRRRGLAATALRRDAAALAGTIYAAARWAGAFRFRRGVCTDVGAVPGVLGGGLPVGLSGRLPVDVDPRGPPVNIVVVTSVSALAVAVVHSVAFAIGRRIGRYNVVDVVWGLGFVAVAVAAATLGHGDPVRRWLLLALVSTWGLRLSWHMYRKTAGQGEDPRYADLLRGATPVQPLRKVFGLQGLLTLFVSFPLQLSAVTGPTPKPLLAVGGVGLAVWLVGITFEAVGDWQLWVFKSDPANRGVIMDRGLWAWTRHPNYFGDACVWWGLWLITINDWAPLATVGSPLLMTYLLVDVSGARLTERYLKGRPGFAEYQRRTAYFVPRPPRSARR